MPTSFENELSIGITLQAQTIAPPHTAFVFPVDFEPLEVTISDSPLSVRLKFTNGRVVWGSQKKEDFDEETAVLAVAAQISPFLAFYKRDLFSKFADEIQKQEFLLPFPTQEGMLRPFVDIGVYTTKAPPEVEVAEEDTDMFDAEDVGEEKHQDEEDTDMVGVEDVDEEKHRDEEDTDMVDAEDVDEEKHQDEEDVEMVGAEDVDEEKHQEEDVQEGGGGAQPLHNYLILATFAPLVPGQSPYVQVYNTGDTASFRIYCSNLDFIYVTAQPDLGPGRNLEESQDFLRLKFPNSHIVFREN